MAVSRALIEANKKYHALPSKEKEKSDALKKLYDEEIVKEAKPVIKVGDNVFTIKAGEDVLNGWMESLQNPKENKMTNYAQKKAEEIKTSSDPVWDLSVQYTAPDLQKPKVGEIKPVDYWQYAIDSKKNQREIIDKNKASLGMSLATDEEYKRRMRAMTPQTAKDAQVRLDKQFIQAKNELANPDIGIDEETELRTRLSEIENQKREYQKLEEKLTYDSLRNNDDFFVNSGYYPKKDKSSLVLFDFKDPDDLYAYINTNEETWMRNGRRSAEGRNLQYNFITPEERAMFNYIYNTKGSKEAGKYIDFLSESHLKKDVYEYLMEAAYKSGKEAPVTSSIASVAENTLGGIVGLYDGAKQLLTGEVDPYSTSSILLQGSAQLQRGAEENIDSNVGKFMYKAGMLISEVVADVLVSKGLAKIGSAGKTAYEVKSIAGKITSALMSSKSAMQATLNSVERGDSDDKAIAIGVITGTISYLTEKYSIEQIIKNPTTIKGALSKAFIAEGTEELTENWAGRILDLLAHGDDNDFIRAYNKYISDGESKEEALVKVILDEVGEDVETFALGGISGFGLTTLGGIDWGNYAKYETTIRNLGKKQKDSARELISHTIENFGIDSEGGKKAVELEKKLDKGKKATAREVGEIIYENEKQKQEEEKQAINNTPDTLEKVAMDVVAKRNATQTAKTEPVSNNSVTGEGLHAQKENELEMDNKPFKTANSNESIPLLERILEAKTKSNEPIAVEDIKKATGFGEEGSKLVTELANRDGVTFNQAKRAVETAYLAGLSNVDGTKVNFETDTQIDAFTAGKKDAVMQDLTAKESANQKRAKSGMSAEEGYNYFDSLTEDDNRIRTIKVNGITIRIDKRFGGGYFVSTEFNNGEKLTPWAPPEEFDTFEEAKTHAAMSSYYAEEYDGGLAPIDKFYGRNVSGVKIKDVEISKSAEEYSESVIKMDNSTGKGNILNHVLNDTSKGDIIVEDNNEEVTGNGTITSRKTSKSNERYSKVQIERKSEAVQNRRIDGLYTGTTTRDDRNRNRNISTRTAKVETRELKNVIEDDNFIILSRKVGNSLTRLRYKALYSQILNDSRFDDGYDFSEVITYDMLIGENNELRNLFADEIDEYFNTDNTMYVDSTGKRIEQALIEVLKDSVARNNKGQLIPLYHATNKVFDKFKIGDVGFHFGSYNQARQLAESKGFLEDAIFIKAYLDIKNPLYVDEDFEGWHAKQIAQKLSKMGILSNDEGLYFYKQNEENAKRLDEELVKILQDKGYDGIIYKNEHESGYADSYIVFDDSQIIRTESAEEVSSKTNVESGTTNEKPVDSMYYIPQGSEIVNNIVVDEHSKRLKRENPRAYSNIIRMAKRLGMNVRFVKNLADDNGNVLEGLITSKGIFINADAKNPSRFVATHEFGHRMKQAAPKVWAKYQEYVINKLKMENFDSGRTVYDILYEETKNAYGKDDADYINEEIAVNYAGELFESEEMLESFIREDKGLALRVRDWWYKVLEGMGLLSEKKKAQQLWLKAYTAAAKNVAEGKVGDYSGEKFKYVGETEDGRKIYRTNYKEGTPKSVKQKDLIDIIQNIWSKKPIHLAIKENGVYKEISANFNPELSERSDLSKIVFGNRKGNGSEKRMTLDLSADLYQIASDAKHTGSKAETGKDNKAHDGVKHWYYFITNLVYEDVNGKRIDCYMNIDVKENQYGHYFYSFAIEKGTAPQTLLAVVSDDMSPTVPIDTSISQDTPSVNSYSMQNTAENAQEGKKSIPGTRLSELVEKYGAIPNGEKPHRDVQVPQKTAKDKKVSETVRTILEAKATPDEALPTIEKMVVDGVFSYDVYTDKQAIKDAQDSLKGNGWIESYNSWMKDTEKGVVSKQHTVMGWALYNNAVNTATTTTSETERKTAMETAINILDAMVKHQRSAAQALQATRVLKKLSPETQLYGVQKSVQAFQKELNNKYGKKSPNLKIDEKLAEQFLNAKTEDERLAAEKEIYKDIGRQIPSRFIDKWNAWRYLSMLGNLRTHDKNFLGNAGFAPVVLVKDLTATAIESAVWRVSGKKMLRSKALVWGSKSDRALLKAAWNDYANVADVVSNGGKYNDFAMTNQLIEEGRQIFKNKFLEWARKKNSQLLEAEDVWFSKPHYAYALAQYCKANKIIPEQISRGRAIGPAREYAIKEAQKATYKDTNAFSQMVSGWGRSDNKNPVTKVFNTGIEGVLPYRRTPANVLVRGVEYSPLGLIKGLSRDLYKVSKGEMSAAEAIDNISAGLTGTGLLALGVYLAAQGLVRGHGEEDKDEKEFKEMMGHQPYSLELPNGKSITLDWLAPEALPFFVGVNLWESTKGSSEKVNFSTILKAVSNISEPMLEMSCLQSLNNLFESVGYATSNDTSGLMSILVSATTSYIMGGLPTVSGQAERTGEEYRMTTYTEKNSFFTKDMQYTLGKASAKIPFWDYNQIPYIDAWGRKEASGTALKRGFNNFLNPAYTSTIESSDMENELLRLYEMTGEAKVFPSRADKYFTVDGERKDLTAEEYVRYATLKGEKSYKLVSDLVESEAYKKLDDGEKIKAIAEAYDYANQKAKQTISNYKPSSWVTKADEFGSNVGNYLSFRAEVDNTKAENGDEISKQQVADIILDMAQNDSETWKMYLSMYENESATYVRDKGVLGEAYMNFLDSLNEVDKPTESGKYGTYTQDEAKEAINQLEGLSREDKATLWQSVNMNWKAKNNPFR